MKLLHASLIAVFVGWASLATAATDRALIDGFNKTVFNSEYAGFAFSRAYVRKFPGTVRFYIRSETGATKRREVEQFVLSLNRLIHGLTTKLVNSEAQANFVVHLVMRSDYADTVRDKVYERSNAPVRGRCMVRALYSRSGISRSEAVIVGDEGRALFRRCMTEEILQGLGPLDDDASLSQSMFNDTSRFTTFRRFDRLLVSMLYDKRIRPGMSQTQVEKLLPAVLRDVRRRIEGR